MRINCFFFNVMLAFVFIEFFFRLFYLNCILHKNVILCVCVFYSMVEYSVMLFSSFYMRTYLHDMYVCILFCYYFQ